MWWEFKLILSLGIVCGVLGILRSETKNPAYDHRAAQVQWLCFAIIIATLFWFIWGPRPFWDPMLHPDRLEK